MNSLSPKWNSLILLSDQTSRNAKELGILKILKGTFYFLGG